MRPHSLPLALSLVAAACGRGAPGPSAPVASPPSDRDGGPPSDARQDREEPPRNAGRPDPFACASHRVAQPGVPFTLARVTRDVPSVDISFPQLAERGGTSLRPVNAAVRRFVDTEVREYLDDLSAGEGVRRSDLKGVCEQCPVCCYCKADCVPTWVSSRLTSVACTKSCGGGAYPNTGWWTLVLDTSHRPAPRRVRLDELVPPESRDAFWRALDLAVRKNAACMGETSWDSPLDEEGLGDLDFFVTPDSLVVFAPLPHVALAFAECAFPRSPAIEWLRPDLAW